MLVRWFSRIVGTVFMMAVAACVSLLNAAVPEDNYTLSKDIAYADGPRHSMDIYVPRLLQPHAPVILFIYGGSWQFGNKADYKFVGEAFAEKGFITVIADYRLYPDVRYPAFVEDNALALRFVHDHIASFGGDPSNIFVAGHSAGGYNAMMLAANPVFIKEAGGLPSTIRGVIGIAGPYNFNPSTDKNVHDVFAGTRDDLTKPIDYATSSMPPVFIAHGQDDDIVGLDQNSEAMAKKLKTLHVPVETHYYPDVGHIGIILSLATPLRGKAPLLSDIAQFVERYRVK